MPTQPVPTQPAMPAQLQQGAPLGNTVGGLTSGVGEAVGGLGQGVGQAVGGIGQGLGQTLGGVGGAVGGLLGGQPAPPQPAPPQQVAPQPQQPVQAAPPPPAAPAPQPVPQGQSDLTAQLQQLIQLKESGALSEEEFQAAKAKLLGK
ncbi:MAG: SHOCT domain-containing protein [Ktedonobacterales bacterium]